MGDPDGDAGGAGDDDAPTPDVALGANPTLYDDVLVPTDGSEGTAAAVRHAGAIAAAFDATIHVLSVVDTRNRFESPSAGLAADAWLETQREHAETAIEGTVDDLPAGLDVERVVAEGVPKTEILDYVEERGMDMIVMGTHGRTGIDHYLIGSVAEKVIRRSPVPVVTVRLDGA